MNGRMYDPVLGRMLSADNNVQNSEFTQSYNKYGYCNNNPLRFTDPSGYDYDFISWSLRQSINLVWDNMLSASDLSGGSVNTPFLSMLEDIAKMYLGSGGGGALIEHNPWDTPISEMEGGQKVGEPTAEQVITNLLKMPVRTMISMNEMTGVLSNLSKYSWAINTIERTESGFNINPTWMGKNLAGIPEDATATVKQVSWLTDQYNKEEYMVYQITLNFWGGDYWLNNNAYRALYSNYSTIYPLWQVGYW